MADVTSLLYAAWLEQGITGPNQELLAMTRVVHLFEEDLAGLSTY